MTEMSQMKMQQQISNPQLMWGTNGMMMNSNGTMMATNGYGPYATNGTGMMMNSNGMMMQTGQPMMTNQMMNGTMVGRRFTVGENEGNDGDDDEEDDGGNNLAYGGQAEMKEAMQNMRHMQNNINMQNNMQMNQRMAQRGMGGMQMGRNPMYGVQGAIPQNQLLNQQQFVMHGGYGGGNMNASRPKKKGKGQVKHQVCKLFLAQFCLFFCFWNLFTFLNS